MTDDALRFGLVTSAPVNVALSADPGARFPTQLAFALKSVPVLFHVMAVAFAQFASPATAAAATGTANTARRAMRPEKSAPRTIPPDASARRAPLVNFSFVFSRALTDRRVLRIFIRISSESYSELLPIDHPPPFQIGNCVQFTSDKH